MSRFRRRFRFELNMLALSLMICGIAGLMDKSQLLPVINVLFWMGLICARIRTEVQS